MEVLPWKQKKSLKSELQVSAIVFGKAALE